ncbi:MAG: glycoside hydrolase family 13 protein [Lysobacterales bacterium]
MDRMNVRCLFLLFALLLSQAAFAGPAHIARLEPPSWWTGFREHSLQLLVYGAGISEWEPQVDYPGVTVSHVERVDSPNYLFVYLDIGEDAKPGTFDILFARDRAVLRHAYTLGQKNPDPAWTRGFGPGDAIYLITPDRFANGNSGNDSLPGMGDPADRSDMNGRHGGDIRGITEHLDYIADMGFTAVWLSPVLENRMPEFSYHGYSTTDFYRVDPRLGSNESYRNLVAAARDKGLGVIMDMIVNHVGTGHWWIKDPPTRDWINFQGAPVMTLGEHITEQDPHASRHDRRLFSDGWFVDTMPDLNQRNPLLADYLTQNALWWIEYLGLSGIRMDTYPFPDKRYMTEWTRRVMLEYPDFNVVGEEWTENPAAVAYWQRGNVNRDGYVSYLPSLMDFPLQNALRWGLVTAEGSKFADLRPAGLLYLYRALANDFVYPDPDALVIFPDNHDMSRIFTQVGEDYDLFRMAMAYVLTMRGTPQIYYGTEILMANPGTEEHGVIRSDFPGGWVGDPVNGFSGQGLSPLQAEAQAYLRKLLLWRRDTAVLHSGKTMQFVPENGTYAYFRYDDQDCVMVIFNKNAETVDLDLARFAERLQGFTGFHDVLTDAEGPLGERLTLPARSVRVLELEKAP